jgi:hypothetical protein
MTHAMSLSNMYIYHAQDVGIFRTVHQILVFNTVVVLQWALHDALVHGIRHRVQSEHEAAIHHTVVA